MSGGGAYEFETTVVGIVGIVVTACIAVFGGGVFVGWLLFGKAAGSAP